MDKEGRKEEALQRYKEALEVDEKFDKAWFYKFKIHYEFGQIDEAARCAQKAVDRKPSWVKFIRDVEKKVQSEHGTQYDEIPLVLPEPKPKTGIIKMSPGIDEKTYRAFLMLKHFEVRIDGKIVTIASSGVGMHTIELDGLGPQTITDPDTEEEWIIERNGKDVIILSHTDPKRIIDEESFDPSKEFRLSQALSKIRENREKEIEDKK